MQIISFNSFKSYLNEILKKLIQKIMQELIKIKHINLKISLKNYNITSFLRYKCFKLIWCYLKNFNKALMKII
jgi:hypothetical protein